MAWNARNRHVTDIVPGNGPNHIRKMFLDTTCTLSSPYCAMFLLKGAYNPNVMLEAVELAILIHIAGFNRVEVRAGVCEKPSH